MCSKQWNKFFIVDKKLVQLIENTNSDVFIIEEPTPAEDTILIEEEVSNENSETENVIFEPAVQVEEKAEPVITETGEDLSVPFVFASSSAPEEKVEPDVLKSESSMAFNSLLEEVQAEEVRHLRTLPRKRRRRQLGHRDLSELSRNR